MRPTRRQRKRRPAEPMSEENSDVSERMVLPKRIELLTSPLPRECSTPELRQLNVSRRPVHKGLLILLQG